MQYRFLPLTFLLPVISLMAAANPVQTASGGISLKSEGKTYYFSPCIKDRQWRILSGKPDQAGRYTYLDKTNQPVVIAATGFVSGPEKDETELSWEFEIVNPDSLRNVAIVLRLPLKALHESEIRVGKTQKFQIGSSPASANQIRRGNTVSIKNAGKTLGISLNRTSTIELMDLRRFNPAQQECELRFFVMDSADQPARGTKRQLNMKLRFSSGEQPPPKERTQWQEGNIINKVTVPGKNWIPFNFAWRDCREEPVWGNFGIEAPAGKYGFLTADGATFKAGNRRIRLWGCCLSSGRAATPSHEDASLAARFLRRRGYNAVRFTHLA